jgi:hypothetical protein
MRSALGLQDEEMHPADKACEECCPKMTMQQRVIGYCVTFSIGCVLNIFSWVALGQLVQGNVGPFVALCLIGNVTQLLGSLFLRGPISFGRKLISRDMRLATILYFVSSESPLWHPSFLVHPIIRSPNTRIISSDSSHRCGVRAYA